MIPTITLAMIVRNEEKYLAKCLVSAQEAVDEIVIVDTGSSDKTIEIAKQYTDKIYRYRWNGDFSAARNFALSKSSGQWILVLDADEVLDTSGGSLREAITANFSSETIFLPLRCLRGETLDSLYNHFLVLRLFRNIPEYRFAGKIHEQVTLPCPETVSVSDYPVIWHKPMPEKLRNKKRHRNLILLQKVLKDEPDNYFLRYYLAVEWLGLGRFDKALPLFTEVYANLSKEQILFRAPALTGLVICLRQQEKLAEAFKACVNECRSYPNFTDIFFDAGTILAELGNYEQAISWFEAAVKLGVPPPEFAHTHGTETFLAFHNLGCCYEYLGECSKAEEYYQQALVANPEYVGSLYQLFFLKLRELGAKSLFTYLRKSGYFRNLNHVRLLGRLFFAADFPNFAAACYAENPTDDLPTQVKSMLFCGEVTKAKLAINNAKINKYSLPLDIEISEIIAEVLNADYAGARQLALKMWRAPKKRNTALALLMIVSNFESGYSRLTPEKTREPEVVHTLLVLLDDCLRYKPKNLTDAPKTAGYLQLAEKITNCLTQMTADSNLALILYLKAKGETASKNVAYNYLLAGSFHHG